MAWAPEGVCTSAACTSKRRSSSRAATVISLLAVPAGGEYQIRLDRNLALNVREQPLRRRRRALELPRRAGHAYGQSIECLETCQRDYPGGHLSVLEMLPVVLDERVHGGRGWPLRASLVNVHRRSEGAGCCGVNPPSGAPSQVHRWLSHRQPAHSEQQPHPTDPQHRARLEPAAARR